MPTWSTNIIGARHVWEKMGCPHPDKEATELGKVVEKPRWTIAKAQNKKKYHDFVAAVKLQFAMIDMKKNQGKSKGSKETHIHNELKIITASKDVYDLWSELISYQSQGELIDPDSLLKYRQLLNWDQEKDGVMPREFFKWLGNCSEGDLKRLALHLLGRTPNRKLAHPKVTMKKIAGVLADCYTAKEWLERCKRKQIVRRQLHFLKKNLNLFSNKGNYRRDKWKEFKKNYNVTKATKNTLLTGPPEEFFSLAKMPSNKNKSIGELSPNAAEFFRIFLSSKGKFVKPEAIGSYRPYDLETNNFGTWDDGVWEESTSSTLKLAVMDFRHVPGVINKGVLVERNRHDNCL